MKPDVTSAKTNRCYPSWLCPSAPPDLLRMGSRGDGGYLLPSRVLMDVQAVLGMGLFDDWSFEEWIYQKTGAKVAIFDHTVGWRFWLRRSVAHFVRGALQGNKERLKKLLLPLSYCRFFNNQSPRHFKIGIGNAPNMVGLEQAMTLAGMTNGILLKVDIEGAEYEILQEIVKFKSKLVACVIEFHLIDQHMEALERFVVEMTDDFTLVHFHANNFASNETCTYSSFIELSFMTKRLIAADEVLVKHELPLKDLDHPSIDWRPDVKPVFA